MSTDANKRPSRTFNSKTKEGRISESPSVHGMRTTTSAAFASMPAPAPAAAPASPPTKSSTVFSDAATAADTQLPMMPANSSLLESEPTSSGVAGEADRTEPVEKVSSSGKPKADIETLEQFITYAYSRKGQRVLLKSKTERLIAQDALDDAAMTRLQIVTEGDALLAVPRQLLLVSLEVEGLPRLRAALNTFVSTVMLRHPIFARDEVQAAVHNLPGGSPMEEALAIVASCIPPNVEGKDRPKQADLQALRRNAVHLLATWFACNRGLNSEQVTALLFRGMWEPATRELMNDNARLRALTEMEQTAGVGLACHRFRQQATEARSAQDHAQREAATLRQQVAEFDEQYQQEQNERKVLAVELEALRTNSANKIAELLAQHEAERMHLRHELEQLRGRLVRRLGDSIEMLEVGLTALRNKTPRTEVMAERAEHVVDELRTELANLKEE